MKSRRRALLLALAGAAAALALAAGGSRAEGGSPAAGPRAQEEPRAADPSEILNALLGTLMGSPVDEAALQKQVQDAGGIAFKRDVPIAFLNRQQLADYVRELFDAEYPVAIARVDERLLTAFDLLPAGTDLRALRARVLEENVVGFYDERPDRQRLYAVSEERALTPMNQIVLAHELRHALQDQYAQLHEAVAGGGGDFDDRRLAAISLFEGDATLVMERFVRLRLGGLAGALEDADEGGAGAAALAAPGLFDIPGAPPVVRDHLVQPYLAGLTLARALWARGGAEAMVEAWTKPPESTEQVLHPALYFSREAPRGVSARQPAPPGAEPLSEGVLGELLLRTLLEGDEAAAAGWGGDGWRLWDVRGRTALAWRSEWDTPGDAIEFHAGLLRRFARLHGAARTLGEWDVFAAAPWSFAVRREAGAVELVSADDAQVLRALLSREEPRADAGEPMTGEAESVPDAGASSSVPDALDFRTAMTRVPGEVSDGESVSRDPTEGGVMATSTPPGNSPTNLGMAPNVAGLLCYVPCCVGLVFSGVAAVVEKQSRFVRFHAFQGLLLNGAAIVLFIGIQVLQWVLGLVGAGFLAVLMFPLTLLVALAALGASIYLMIKANANEETELPVIGPMARQWV